MYYNVLWITAKPNNRMNGINHMKKLAQIDRDEHGLDSRVYIGIAHGPTNLIGFLTPYASMAAMVEAIDAIGASDSFAAWSVEAEKYLDLTTAEWQTFRVLRDGGGNASANFLNTIAVHITPGQMVSALEMLNKFADLYETTYGRPVDLLSLEGGLHYRHYITISYDSLEQYDAVQAALADDEAYAQWAVDMMGMFDNRTIEKGIGRYV